MSFTRRVFALLVAVVALATPVRDAVGAVRVTPEGAPPFTLVEVATAEGTRWYDAESWLHHLPGTTDWDAAAARLTYRQGNLLVALTAAPPYALRGTRPLGDAPATKVIDGRLAVGERFLVERSADFLGQHLSVEPAHGTGTLRIVLDPAHGGADKGNTAPGAAAEKDAVLPLAQETAARLRKKGFDVRLTREDNRSLSLSERAATANRWQADLFLSLHASGVARPQARGYEVFLAETSKTAADGRLWAAGQVGLTGQSRRWAEAVRSELGRVLASFDRGVREMPNPLLEAVACPACLLEAGNLSWPEDAEVFTKPQARAALAAALADAADAYFRSIP